MSVPPLDERDRVAAATFAARRERLLRRLRGVAAAVLPGAHEAVRNGDVHYPFRQDSSFLYLTGFEEPDAVAVLRPRAAQRYVLFVRPRDPARAVWDGERAGVEGARRRFGADAAYPIAELEQRLPRLIAEAGRVYYPLGADAHVDRIVTAAVARRRGAPNELVEVIDPQPLIAQARLIKSPEEVRLIERAIAITSAGIEAAMRATRPGVHEYELRATLEAEYRRRGSPRDAFPPIVAAGANACVLHYPDARARVRAGDLVLLDTGAEVAGYGADITRTYPANGRFSAAQRAVYDVVSEAQRAAIATIAPGVLFDAVHRAAVRVLVDGLRDLKVLRGRTDALIRRDAHRPYFMHGTSHWLGLDVHDVGAYRDLNGAAVRLRPGMVLTVEPGLYIAPDAAAPRALRGIGVRIEDDVLVTRAGRRTLSAAIPADPEALEALAGSTP